MRREEAFARAVAFHQAGRLDEAERLYLDHLAAAPRHLDTLKNLGLLYLGRRDWGSAARTLAKAAKAAPADGEFQVLLGIACAESGQLADAVKHYRQSLRTREHPETRFNLGNALAMLGRRDEAEAEYRKGLALAPAATGGRLNLAHLLRESGRHDEALAAYAAVLTAEPDNPATHIGASLALSAAGRGEEALAAARKAKTNNAAQAAEAHNAAAVALDRLGRHAEAADSFRRALESDPTHPRAVTGLASALIALDRPAEAEEILAAAAARGGPLGVHLLLSETLSQRGKWAEAEAAARRATALAPDSAAAWVALGSVLLETGNDAPADKAFDTALRHDRRSAAALFGKALTALQRGDGAAAGDLLTRATRLAAPAEAAAGLDAAGQTFMRLGVPEKAIPLYREALAAAPGRAATLAHLGEALRLAGEDAEAVACLEQAVARQPGRGDWRVSLAAARRAACDWRQADEDEAAVLARVRDQGRPCDPMILSWFAVPPADQLANARRALAPLSLPAETRLPPPPPRPAKGPIRVGYLSANFREHAVARLAVGVIEGHHRPAFEVVGYSTAYDDGSALRRRLEGAFDRFVDLTGVDDRRAAEIIRGDGIDILVDLTGPTLGHRLRILALRPAPVQVSWLGFPGSMGADFIDHVLVDPILAPPGHQPFYSERLAPLTCYQAGEPQREALPAVSRQDCGLPADGVVFCSFSHAYKFTPPLFAVWMRLLAAVPGSVLWLTDPGAHARANLQHEAAERGLPPERLVFCPRRPMAEYLARLRLADIFLDTQPYGAGATANDVLWCGVPLVTLTGETYVGRMAASLVTAAGLGELATASLAEYEATALRLATDGDARAGIRARAEAARTSAPLFDVGRFVGELEAAYRRML